MNRIQLARTVSRRGALKLLSAGGISAAAGYLLYEYAPWLKYEEQANQSRSALKKSSAMPAKMRGLVRYATLAANGHNTQPWKFVIEQNEIEMHPDYSRRLAVVDPGDRELWISLGCALENLLIAARAVGYKSEVTYPEAAEFIHIRLLADTPRGGPLFDAIPLRQNTRSVYDGKHIREHDLDKVQNLPLEPGIALRFVLDRVGMKTVLQYVNAGNLSQYSNKAFLEELIHWLRFNKREAMASMDGLYSGCSGNPEAPRWLGRIIVAQSRPQQQADADAKKLLSSSGVVVIASASEDRSAWVRTGQVYERMALRMTSLNIKSAFLNQPIEIAEVRGQFQEALSLKEMRPELLVRFGYADPMPRSLRRPLEQVSTESRTKLSESARLPGILRLRQIT